VKVFCLGLSKTGTSTFGECMRAMGLRHRTGPGDYGVVLRHAGRLDPLWAIAERYDSFDDLPWPLLYRELAERLPDARFVLTVRRDTETWYRSWCQHRDRVGPTVASRLVYGPTTPQADPAGHKDYYEHHNAAVQAYFEGTDRLLTMCWERGDGYRELGAFLGLKVPPYPPPRRNAAAAKDPRRALRRLVLQGKTDHAEYFARTMNARDPGLYDYFIELLAEREVERLERRERQSRRRWLRRLLGLTTRA